MDDWFNEIVNGYEDESSISKEDIYEMDEVKEKLEYCVDEIYFHTYNLYVNIQNEIYSKFFYGYKLSEMLDYRFDSVKLFKPKEKEL